MIFSNAKRQNIKCPIRQEQWPCDDQKCDPECLDDNDYYYSIVMTCVGHPT